MHSQLWRVSLFIAATLAVAAGPAMGFSTYFSTNCAGCHSNDSVSCIGCHHHGGAGGSPGTATTDKTLYAPGETITVTLTGSSRGGWARAILYNQNNAEVARVTGPTGTGDDGTGDPSLHFPFTLQAPAPTTPGTYTWDAAWWGSPYDTGNTVAFPHGPEVRRTTNQFTVSASVVTGSVVINSGAAYTSTTAVSLALSVTSTGVTQMRFSNDNATWSAWQPFAAAAAWTMTAGNGLKTVYAQFGDSGGTVLASANDTITLDSAAPTGSIVINSGAVYTNTLSVNLALSATDGASGVAQMRFSNDNATWSAWESYGAAKVWSLAGADGAKTVYVQYKDVAGNVSPSFSDGITLDTTAPSGSILINGGAAATTSPAVTLTLSASDALSGVAQMRFSNDNATWSAWQAFAATKSWVLGTGLGLKTVYVQYNDVAGNVSGSFSDSITLNPGQPTGIVTINAGAPYTNLTTVSLELVVAGVPATRMRFSNDNVSWSPWEPEGPAKTWSLSPGDAMKTVYVQWGNTGGAVLIGAQDSILLDQTPPDGLIRVNGGAYYTSATAVTLSISAGDAGSGMADMRFSPDNLAWGVWEPYATTKPWTFSSGDGMKQLYVQFRDGAGNMSGGHRGRIVLDTAPPTGSIQIANGAPSTAWPLVALQLLANDTLSGVADMRFHTEVTGFGPWEAYALYKDWSLLGGDGPHTITVQYRDFAGNLSAPTSDSIVLDVRPPTGTIRINGGAPQTSSTAVTLNLSATDLATSVTDMRFGNDGVSFGAWEHYATSRAWILVAGNGFRTVYVQFRDASGNISASASATILLGALPPSTVLINAGRTYTTSTAVTLTLNVTTNTATRMRFSNNNTSWSAWEPRASSKAWTLTSGEGNKNVFVQWSNAGGQLVASATDAITLDATRPTGRIVINGDALATTSTSVVLTLSATDLLSGMSDMRFSNDGRNWSNWVKFARSRAWILPSGKGQKTVWAQFRDRAGNVSLTVSDSIMYAGFLAVKEWERYR